MKGLRLIGLLIVTLNALTGTWVSADSEHECGGKWRENMAEALGLSEDQRSALAGKDNGSAWEIKKELSAERETLNRMLRDKSIPDDDIRSQLRKVEAIDDQWNTRRLEKMLRARKVLTDEQLKKLLDMYQNRKSCKVER